MAILPPFRPRLDTLLRGLYAYDRMPTAQIKGDDSSASWTCDGSDMWSTSGEFDRLTKLVLLSHALRLQVTITAFRDAAGFRVIVEPRGHAPGTLDHHPGLSDIVATCYAMGNKIHQPKERS